jgi:hypothetical protein
MMPDKEEGNNSDTNSDLEVLDKREEAEAAFWRMKRASDEWREGRVKRVLAQENESLVTTLGRVAYLSACILFDGVILMEIPYRMGRTTISWFVFALLLYAAIKLQLRIYEKFYKVDVSQIQFLE